MQSQTMAFASRYIASMADTYSDIQMNSTTPEAQLIALRRKIVAAYGAIGCAAEFNPFVGLMDMAMMVTLSREIAEKPWNAEVFGPENAAKIVSVLKRQEADVWSLVTPYLTSAQVAELHGICEQWQREHPDLEYAINVGLADLAQAYEAKAQGPAVGSVLGLVGLDPFGGLDPALREVQQSRVLAERVSFELRHMPMLLSWQANSLYLQMLATAQAKQFLADTTRLAGSTTRFSESSGELIEVSSRFADTLERFRVQLPEQQEKLIEQLNQLIAKQGEAALKQATTQVSLQRDETIKLLDAAIAVQREAALNEATTQVALQRDETISQVNTTLIAQQKLMAEHLQNTMDRLIDRLYERARWLVLIAAGSILVVLLIYRLIARGRIPTGNRT